MKLLVVLLFLTSVVRAEVAPSVAAKNWLLVEVNTIGFSWQDLGLEKEVSFTGPLLEAWKKWLLENRGENLEAEICQGPCLSYEAQWEGLSEEELKAAPPSYTGKWLRVVYNLRRTSVKGGESSFEWEGRVVLQDVQTKRTIVSSEIREEKKSFRNVDQKTLNSQLASYLYRSAHKVFPLVLKDKEAVAPKKSSLIIVQGQKNASEVFELMEALKAKGSQLSLEVSLEGLKKDEARLRLYYLGEEKAFSDLLSQLKELKSSYNFEKSSDAATSQYVLKLASP